MVAARGERVAALGAGDGMGGVRVSDLEALLLAHIRGVGLPEPVAQYKFHPKRRFRADFAWPDAMLLVECDGAVWKGTKGGHTSGKGYTSGCEKQDEAAVLGYRLMRFTREQIESGYAVGAIERALTQGEGRHG